MTFALSGSTITQSGTDNGISGISANGAPGTTVGLITTYNAGTNALVVNGTMTIDATTQKLQNSTSGSKITINSGGSLTIRGQKTGAGSAPYPYLGLEHYSNLGGDTSGNAGFNLVSSNSASPASLTLIDTAISITGNSGYLLIGSGNFGTITTQGDRCWILNSNGSGASQGRIRCNAANVLNFTANKTYVGVWLNFGYPQTSLKGFTPINVDGPEINAGAGGAVATLVTLEDYDTTYVVGNYYAGTHITVYGGAHVRLKNNRYGTNITTNFNQAVVGDSTASNIIEFSKVVSPIVKNELGGPLSGAYIYLKPVGTLPAVAHPKSGANTSYSLAILTGTTDSQGVLTTPLEFIYAQTQTNSNGQLSVSSYNYFCSTTTRGAESHTVYCAAFGYKKSSQVVNLFGTGAAAPLFSMVSKLPVVSTESQASAISGITFTLSGSSSVSISAGTATAQQIYDYWVYWTSLSAQFDSNQELVTISGGDLVVTGSITTSGTISKGGNVTRGLVCSGTASVTGSGVYTLPVTDSTGVEVEITDINPNAFVLGSTFPASVLYKNTGESTWNVISSSTASSLKFKRAASASVDVAVRVPGYTWKSFTVNTGTTGLVQSAGLSPVTAVDGTVMWPVATVQAQMDAITYDSVAHSIAITNSGGSRLDIELQSAWKKFSMITHDPNLIGLWSNQIELNPTRTGFVIPTGNPTVIRLSAGSNANVLMNFVVTHAADFTSAIDRFFGNASGFSISIATSVNQLSLPIPTTTDIKTAIESTTVLAKKTDIPTPPTAASVATAVRTELTDELANMDAAISTRLAATGYTAPTTPPTAAAVATAVRTELTDELANMDAAISTRLASTDYTAPSTAPTAATIATAVRTELTDELANIDAAISTRLAATGYTAPTTPPTTAQIVTAIEATTVLAKKSDLTTPPTTNEIKTAVRDSMPEVKLIPALL